MNLEIRNIDPQGDIARSLLAEATIDVWPLYHGTSTPVPPAPTNSSSYQGPRDIYVAAWLGELPVGCGAIRELDPHSAEIKRMYVHRDYRRRDIGRAILIHLQSEARRLGYTRMVLETGNRQGPAMAMYEASGFRRVEPYGKHNDDPTSVCYELVL